jgi:hypothetical protein
MIPVDGIRGLKNLLKVWFALRRGATFCRWHLKKKALKETKAKKAKTACPCKRLAMKAVKAMKDMKKEISTMKEAMKSMSQKIDSLQDTICVLQGINVEPDLFSPSPEGEPAKPPGFSLMCMIKHADGSYDTLALDVDPSDTVSDVAAKMAVGQGLRPEQLQVLWDGDRLDGDTMLMPLSALGVDSSEVLQFHVA